MRQEVRPAHDELKDMRTMFRTLYRDLDAFIARDCAAATGLGSFADACATKSSLQAIAGNLRSIDLAFSSLRGPFDECLLTEREASTIVGWWGRCEIILRNVEDGNPIPAVDAFKSLMKVVLQNVLRGNFEAITDITTRVHQDRCEESDDNEAFELVQADEICDHKAATPRASAFTTFPGELHHTNSSMARDPLVPPAPQSVVSPYSEPFENSVMANYGKHGEAPPDLLSPIVLSSDVTPASTREGTPSAVPPTQQQPETNPNLELQGLRICDATGVTFVSEVPTLTTTATKATVKSALDAKARSTPHVHELVQKAHHAEKPTAASFKFASSSSPFSFETPADKKPDDSIPHTACTGSVSSDSAPHLEAYILRPHADTLPNSVTWTYETELLPLTGVGIQAHISKLGPKYSIIDAIGELLPTQLRQVQDHTNARNGKLLAVQYGAAADMVTHMGTFQMRPVVYIIETNSIPIEEEIGLVEKTATAYGEREDRTHRMFAKPVGFSHRNVTAQTNAAEPFEAASAPAGSPITLSSVLAYGFYYQDPSFRVDAEPASGPNCKVHYKTITFSARHAKKDVSLEEIRLADYGAGRTDAACGTTQSQDFSYAWENGLRTEQIPAPRYNYTAPGVQHCCWMPASATTRTPGFSGKSPVAPSHTLFGTPLTPSSGHGLFGGAGKGIFGLPNTTQSGGNLFGENPTAPSTGLFGGISPAFSGNVSGDRRTSSSFGDGMFTEPFAAAARPHPTEGAFGSTSTAPNLFSDPASSKTTPANDHLDKTTRHLRSDPFPKCRECSMSVIFRSGHMFRSVAGDTEVLCDGCEAQHNIPEGLEKRWSELYKKQEADQAAAQSPSNVEKLPLSTTPGALSSFLTSTPASNEFGFEPINTRSSDQGSFLSQFASKAKTYEQHVTERKQRAKEADFDEGEETEEHRSAKYEGSGADRAGKQTEQIATKAPAQDTSDVDKQVQQPRLTARKARFTVGEDGVIWERSYRAMSPPLQYGPILLPMPPQVDNGLFSLRRHATPAPKKVEISGQVQGEKNRTGKDAEKKDI